VALGIRAGDIGRRFFAGQAQWKVVLRSSGYSKCPHRTSGATNANGGDPTLLLLVRQDDPGQVLLSPWSGFSFAHGRPAVLMLDKTGLIWWNLDRVGAGFTGIHPASDLKPRFLLAGAFYCRMRQVTEARDHLFVRGN
jgi:hypothetical protein